MKKCSDCKTSHELTEFGRNRAKADGRDGICKSCRRERNRQWRERHKDRDRDYKRKSRAAQRNGTWAPREYRRQSDATVNS